MAKLNSAGTARFFYGETSVSGFANENAKRSTPNGWGQSNVPTEEKVPSEKSVKPKPLGPLTPSWLEGNPEEREGDGERRGW